MTHERKRKQKLFSPLQVPTQPKTGFNDSREEEKTKTCCVANIACSSAEEIQ